MSSKQDKSFDQVANTFSNNIYNTSKGKLRLSILKDDLTKFLLSSKSSISILDAGGGMGNIALWLAQYVHNIDVIDVSQDMLDKGKKLALEQEINNISFYQSSIQEYEAANKYQAILCHAVLEWLNDPQSVIEHLAKQIDKGGTLSLMFFNYHAKLLGNLVYGNFDYIDKGMQAKKEVKLNPKTQLIPDTVYTWLEGAGFKIIHKRGVRTFHDYMRDIEHQSSKYKDIERYEHELSTLEPFLSIAKYIHVIAIKQ